MIRTELHSAVILKKGKEKIFQKRHHWIFSGAIERFPENMENGDTLPVTSSQGELLGFAYFNRCSGLCGRILSFDKTEPHKAILNNFENAFSLRNHFFDETKTNAYRLVNGEGDSLPGLIVDRYHDQLVIQIGTLGMEKLKPLLIEYLVTLLPVKGIYEKSLLATRKEEGLLPYEGCLFGEEKDELEILEEGLRYQISIKKGQKTGFFLDQREMRALIGSYAKNRSVLNCFAYNGGFSVAALKGGALKVDSVDISRDAIEGAKKNVTLNGFSLETNGFYCEDVFHFLKDRSLSYDIVILDPPAFAKKKSDLSAAAKGYKMINKEAMKNMRSGSILLTCSCSYHVDESFFQQILFQAALEARKKVKIIGRHRLGIDHPINLFHPESDYLKSFLLYIEA